MIADTSMEDPMDRAADDGYAELVSPMPRARSGRYSINVRPQLREVVLVDNDKPNSINIIRATQAELRRRGIAVRDEIIVRPVGRDPIDKQPQLFGQLSRERALVLDGVND
ncbi:hypothetical protein [Pseudonocardia oroxyli]|uniref:Uncharacterized protein n=1 Tax=Pseudonocardia oroxyli TaxID=366584 RepID=A0A1G7TIE7_PSEOR|nr:hypothetical protein [Pseudonocardia oroxyli]SDG34429.1 hypothetical protein SAMN05216377_11126 [Pseudonocardia oroxyli]